MLIYCVKLKTKQELARLHNALMVPEDIKVVEIVQKLEEGRNVITPMVSGAHGFKVPKGTEIFFHDECPKSGALRIQCEARGHRADNL